MFDGCTYVCTCSGFVLQIKEGKVDQAQERQFRELMGRGSDSTDSRTNNLIKNDKRTGTPVVAAPITSNTVPAATPAVAATTPEK